MNFWDSQNLKYFDNTVLVLPILTAVSEGWLILKLSVNIICILQLGLSVS